MILGLAARAAKTPAGRRLGSNGRPNFAQQIGYRLLAADKQARGRHPCDLDLLVSSRGMMTRTIH